MVLIKFAATTFFKLKKTTCTKKKGKKKKSVKIIRCSLLLHGLFWAPCFSLPRTPQKLQHILLNESNGIIERNGIEKD
jgi:hypothetical protein